jgi:integrase
MTNDARTVTLCWKTKTDAGWRYFPCQFHTQHGDYEVVPGRVMDGGVQREYPKGKFFLRSYAYGKKVYTPVESCHPRDAVNALRAAVEASKITAVETETNTEHAAAVRHVETKRNGVPALLKDAAAAYVTFLEKKTHMEAAGAARVCLEEFRTVTKIVYVSKITANDVTTFHTALRERGLSDRTVTNKHDRLCSFLRFAKVEVEGLHKSPDSKGLRPSYEQPEVTTYDDSQMEQLRAGADEYMRLVIDMGQQLGLRMQEIQFAEWDDLKGCMFTVQGKKRAGYEFKVKDKEARTVPVNDALCARLAAWKASHPGTVLILGTDSDAPNRHLLRQLKRMVQREGLNCGRCAGCLKSKGSRRQGEGGCYNWTLHRFRRTYLTTLLRAGVDIKTVQKMAGHSDLASTQRYLDALSAESVQPVVNAIKW